MSVDQITYVLCVKENERHIQESVLVKCSRCFCGLWCAPWNLLSIKICIDCAAKDKENFTFVVKQEDLARAAEVINQDPT